LKKRTLIKFYIKRNRVTIYGLKLLMRLLPVLYNL